MRMSLRRLGGGILAVRVDDYRKLKFLESGRFQEVGGIDESCLVVLVLKSASVSDMKALDI